jgi:hypothetical protein
VTLQQHFIGERRCGYLPQHFRLRDVDPCEWRYSIAAAYYRDEEPVVPITGIEW